MPATVDQAKAVVTAIVALQVKRDALAVVAADLRLMLMRTATANAPVSPAELSSIAARVQDIQDVGTSLAAALVLANIVLANTP